MIQNPRDIKLVKSIISHKKLEEIKRKCSQESIHFTVEQNCIRFTSLVSIHRKTFRPKTSDILYKLGLSRSTHYVFVYNPELYGTISARYLVF